MAQIYTDIEKYIKKEDDLALEKYEIDEQITVILVPYKEISYKYDSGYGAYCCELVLDSDEMPDTFKISGNFVSQLNIGQTYKATGKVAIYNRKKQLKVDEIKKVEPKTIRTIKQFLKSLEGMGPFYDVIYEEFGENSLDMIRNNPLEVKKVAPALYDALVLDWQRQLLELKDSQEYLTTLINFGLKPIQAKQFFDMYKELCVEKIKENPYRLINELNGFGFLKCDTIAKNIGYPPDSEIRINEAIIFTLNTAKYNGNTYMTKEELLEKTSDLLAIKLPVNDMKKLFKSLDGSNKDVIYKVGNLTFGITAQDIIMAMDQYSKALYKQSKESAKLVIFHIPPEDIMSQIEFLKVEGKLIYDEERGKIYDKKLYLAETYIAQKLLKIDSFEEKITDFDIEKLLQTYLSQKNIELESQQYNAVINSASTLGGFSIINGSAGCVDCDTEFFNGFEWKKISEYKKGDKVLQYNKDDTATLVEPLRYIKQPREYLWHFFTKYGIDQCLSDNHNCILFTKKEKLKEEKFIDFKERHLKGNVTDRFKTTFSYSGQGITISNELIRLLVATSADGSYNYNLKEDNKTYSKAIFRLKKRDKIIRLFNLIKDTKLDYSCHSKNYNFIYNDNKFYDKNKSLLNNDFLESLLIQISKEPDILEDYFIIGVYLPFRFKNFPKEWYNCNKEQLEIIADEVMYWDADLKNHKYYCTSIKENADFIQFVFSSLNKRATISIHLRSKNKKHLNKEEYRVLVSNNSFVGLCSDKRPDHTITPIEKYKTKDGFEYCFTVPSHMLVLRRNNKIFITGNCGKTFTLNIALKLIEYVYIKKFGYFEPIVLAPTGRAAKVAASATKREASTIHKALKLTSDGGFYYNAQNNLPYNCIICDETSMLDVELAKYLLEAISNRTKLIFIGDTKQLASVGPGNVLKDIVNSGKFKVTTLNVVKRQSLDSGIYKNAQRIINGQMITSEKETKDAFVYKGEDNEGIVNKIVNMYSKLRNNLTIDQIQVLAPQKAGILGTNYLNFILQDKFNHENIGLRVLNRQISITLDSGNTAKYELYFKQGDKVIHTENDYILPWYQLIDGKLELDENNYCGVSNGETGRIIKIMETEDENRNTITMIIVKYDEKYIIYNNDFSQLDHAYCMTIHKSQGSEWPAVIIPITFSSYRMLEKNLIYTGYTRAKKWIGVIGDPEAMNYAITTEKSSERQTGLEDRIRELS